MSNDFRATSFQTKQIISSGTLGNGTGAKIVIYPIEAQDTPINSGLINQSVFNTSSLNGADIFLYVSGGIGGKDSTNRSITVFGGDVHVSGNMTIGGTGSQQWIEGSPSPRLRTTASIYIGSGSYFAEDFGTDISFYVSGSKYALGYINATNSDFAVFGGDVVISGGLVQGLDNFIATDNEENLNVVIGGTGNQIQLGCVADTIIGSYTSAISDSVGSAIFGGYFNTIRDGGGFNSFNALAGGSNNIISNGGQNNFGGGGSTNIIDDSERSSIICGATNILSNSSDAVIAAADQSIVNIGQYSAIVGGTLNILSSSVGSVLVGGNTNLIQGMPEGDHNSIVAGFNNSIFASSYNFIGGGFANIITNSCNYSAILGGTNNLITGSSNVVLIGSNLTSSLSSSVILGGPGYGVVVSASLGGFTVATGSINIKQGVNYNPKIITSNYDILQTDYILASSASSPITMSLPTNPTTGSAYIVKEIRGLTNSAKVILIGVSLPLRTPPIVEDVIGSSKKLYIIGSLTNSYWIATNLIKS